MERPPLTDSPEIVPSGEKDASPESREFKVEERLAEAEATVVLSEDPETAEKIQAQSAAEQMLEARARIQAIRAEAAELQRQKEEAKKTYPWGFEYLEKERTPQSIYEALIGKKDELTEDNKISSKREASLSEEVSKARQLTLEIGDFVASKLGEAGVPINTRAAEEHSRKVKTKRSIKKYIFEGYLRVEAVEKDLLTIDKGWKLNVAQSTKSSSAAILCEDGSVMTGYGEFHKPPADEDDGLEVFQYRPLRQRGNTGGKDKEEVERSADAGYLDESIDSDITLPNMPVDNPMGQARIIFAQEKALQEAMVQLLIDNGIKP